jgi:hypothetical protein
MLCWRDELGHYLVLRIEVIDSKSYPQSVDLQELWPRRRWQPVAHPILLGPLELVLLETRTTIDEIPSPVTPSALPPTLHDVGPLVMPELENYLSPRPSIVMSMLYHEPLQVSMVITIPPVDLQLHLVPLNTKAQAFPRKTNITAIGRAMTSPQALSPPVLSLPRSQPSAFESALSWSLQLHSSNLNIQLNDLAPPWSE